MAGKSHSGCQFFSKSRGPFHLSAHCGLNLLGPPDQNNLTPGTADAGIEKLPAQQGRLLPGQDQSNPVEFRPLAFVNGHGKGCFVRWQLAQGKGANLRTVFRKEKSLEPLAIFPGPEDAGLAVKKVQGVRIGLDR